MKSNIINSGLVSAAVTIFLGIYGICMTVMVLGYRGQDYRDLMFLTQCEDEKSVREHFHREPEMVYENGTVMPQMGWKLPSREISNKVLVYTNRSALRFYVYIDGNGKVEYVFTSNS